MIRTTGGPAWRWLAAEIAGSASIVLATFLSGAVRVGLGATSPGGLVAAAVSLGLAYGVVAWTFGPRGAHLTPWVTALWAILGGGTCREALLRLGAQSMGAAAAALAVRMAVDTTSWYHGSAGPLGAPVLREAAVSFVLALVVLGVARHRDARVPVALGASACASLLVTGAASVGNPLVVLAVVAVAPPDGPLRWSWSGPGAALLGQLLGAAAGAALGAWTFPWSKESAKALLFQPRSTGGAPAGR